jgi:hypothetical protein
MASARGRNRTQKPDKPAAPDKAERATWKTRIVEFRADVDPKTLKPNPDNWRVHPEAQRRAMSDVFKQLGYVEAVVVNKTTGHIIDGHMRHQLAVEHQEPRVPVLYVQLSIEEERLALTTMNPLAELAVTDPEKLTELLASVPRNGGALDELLADLEQSAGGAVVKHAGQARTGQRSVGQKLHAMRMMMAVPEVATVERALARTGIANRGEALLEICRAYLSENEGDDAKGQHDAGAKGGLEAQLAEAAGALGAAGRA